MLIYYINPLIYYLLSYLSSSFPSSPAPNTTRYSKYLTNLTSYIRTRSHTPHT